MKTAILIFMVLIHTATLAYLVWKLKHVLTYPRRYNDIPGYEEYKKSPWCWDARKGFGKNDPPGYSPQHCMGTSLIVSAWFFITQPITILAAFDSPNTAFCCTPVTILAMFLGMAVALAASCFLPLYSKKPAKICFTIFHLFRGKQRWIVWKRMIIIMLVSLSIFFPIRVMGFFNYAYADEEKLVFSPAYTIKEYVFEYENISEIETVLDENGETEHYYIYNEDGKRFDLCGGIFEKNEIREHVLERISAASHIEP